MRAPEVAKWRRYRWRKWRSSTNSLGNFDGHGELQISSGRRRFGEWWPWFWTRRRPSSASASLWFGPGRRTSASHGRSRGRFGGYFEHQRRLQFEGCVAEPLQTITAILPGSKWSCLLPRVLQDALSEVTQIYPSLKLRVFVDDITALLIEKNKEVAEMAKKVVKKF